MAVPTEPPPDVASASSSALFCLRHLRLGLHLRPEARALDGCLVLELCARGLEEEEEEEDEEEEEEEEEKRKLWTLVLDTHPALRVASVGFRPSPVGEKRCGFVFPSADPPKEDPNPTSTPSSSSPGWGVSKGDSRGTLQALSALASGPSAEPTRPPLTSQDPSWSSNPSRPPLTSQDHSWSSNPPRPPLTSTDPSWSPDPSRPPLTYQDPSSNPNPSRPPLTSQDPSSSPDPSRHPSTPQKAHPQHPSPTLSSWSPDPSRPPLTSQDLSSNPDPSRPPSTPRKAHPQHPSPTLSSWSPDPTRPPLTPRKAHPQHPSPTLSSTHSDCPSFPSSDSRLAHDPRKAVADPHSSSGQACPLDAHHTALASSSAHPGCPSGLSQHQQGLHGDDPAVDLKAFPFSDCSFFPEVPPPPVPTFPDPLALSASPPPRPLFFRVDPFTDYGSALTISLPSSLEPHQPFQVIIRYTTIDAPAIWWLDPELTYGNSKPFVFTQGHSVCNRSFFPCFDTPAVKCTYSAIVKAPAGMQVLMSATQSSYEEQEGIYQFYMEYPIPAYLVALVAGDLVPADIGPRSKVWAEPCLLPTAIGKLSGRVERWLSAAESLYGPYIWGRYDIVFLPPSFPMVAMENPCLTFIISSILESDEFLIIDVIHEVAHSWFGNAVTNATWEEMWLSEGLATYAQRRITTETYGAAFTCLETAFRLDALHRQMKLLGEDNPVSKLQVKLEPGVNPSNLMNLFTYEKGYCFVYYLSQLCGDPMRFDAFLRAYIEKYKFTSVVAQDLLDSFLAFFPELKEQCIDSKTGLEFERWLNATGPPLIEPDLSQGSSLTSPVETLFSLWTTEPLDAVSAANSVNITEWQTFQTVLFLDRLLDGSPLPREVISKLSECYSAHLDSMNAEIRIRWLQIIVRNDYYPDLHKVRRFLENQMSRMYTIPLYEDLCTGTLKSFALEVFYQTQNQLHPNLRKTIQQILTQGLNPLLAMDTTAVTAEALTAGYEDRSPEAVHSAISLRDVNVSA